MSETIKLIQSEQPITNSDINDFENKYHIILPNKYKELVLKYNGGFLNKEVVLDIDGEMQ